MNNLKEIFYNLGKHDASLLRTEAAHLTGTEIINRELSIPNFVKDKDYSEWPVGAPVVDEGQVWTLIQPHNAALYEGCPATLRALWGLCHTKNPEKAKAWVSPEGTSGLYMKDECYKDEEGKVWRSLINDNAYTAAAYPMGWVDVSL